jgi:hypothetical protein
MKYIPLRTIRQSSANEQDRLSSIQHALERNIDQRDASETVTIEDRDYNVKDVRDVLHILNEETLIYFDWIEQHRQLSMLLEGKTPPNSFIDSNKWVEHRFFHSFSTFLKPFLESSLNDLKKNATFEENARLLSFAVLLPADDRMFMEAELFKPLTERINGSKEQTERAESEKALTDAIQPFINDTAIQMVNNLSRASYSTKLNYVDHLLWVIKQRGCTVRLANWILKQLEVIELNPEHRQKVLDLKKDLQAGRITIQNDNLARSKGFSIRSVLYLSSILILLGFSAWIIWKKPFSASDEKAFDTATAYQQFTKEERIKIDSLLRQIQEERDPVDNLIDPSQPIIGSGVSVSIRIPFTNKRMEDLYRDLQLDVDLFDRGLHDTCNSFSAKERQKVHYKNVLPLEKRTGSLDLMMKNEAEYDIYMIVFEDEAKGKIYSLFIEHGTQKSVAMEQGDHVLFVAGNNLGPFIAPKGATDLPSSRFDHHFCATDHNYSESISNLYSLERPQAGINKLLFSGDKNTWFTVVDLYSILEGL